MLIAARCAPECISGQTPCFYFSTRLSVSSRDPVKHLHNNSARLSSADHICSQSYGGRCCLARACTKKWQACARRCCCKHHGATHMQTTKICQHDVFVKFPVCHAAPSPSSPDSQFVQTRAFPGRACLPIASLAFCVMLSNFQRWTQVRLRNHMHKLSTASHSKCHAQRHMRCGSCQSLLLHGRAKARCCIHLLSSCTWPQVASKKPCLASLSNVNLHRLPQHAISVSTVAALSLLAHPIRSFALIRQLAEPWHALSIVFRPSMVSRAGFELKCCANSRRARPHGDRGQGCTQGCPEWCTLPSMHRVTATEPPPACRIACRCGNMGLCCGVLHTCTMTRATACHASQLLTTSHLVQRTHSTQSMKHCQTNVTQSMGLARMGSCL